MGMTLDGLFQEAPREPQAIEAARVVLHRRLGVPWERRALVRSLLRGILPGAPTAGDRRVAQSYDLCGSPLEEIFLEELAAHPHFNWSPEEETPDVAGQLYFGGEDKRREAVWVLQQLTVTHRLDFALIGGPYNPREWDPSNTVRVAVELDGHDFHERTKEQAARDRKRDRDMQEQGWVVLRFTGSEMWRDARACVEQALRVARGNAE